MADIDTSKGAVERFIATPLTEIALSVGLPVTGDDKEAVKQVAVILRALVAERDTLQAKVARLEVDLAEAVTALKHVLAGKPVCNADEIIARNPLKSEPAPRQSVKEGKADE